MLDRILALFSANPNAAPATVNGKARSPHWPAVRKAHLLKEPVCQACGGTEDLQVHHKLPYHTHPELELVDANLVTLCEHPSKNCHLTFGHNWHWKGWNPYVVDDCATMREREKESIKNSLSGETGG
jgi:5-methylcytosine-specific restriction protein A